MPAPTRTEGKFNPVDRIVHKFIKTLNLNIRKGIL
jgi:hypothetical protein